MIETHPFGDFVPQNSRYLLLGSFAAQPKDGYEWFYSNGRNHFWPILQAVYKIDLSIKQKQQVLFTELKMAVTDIILECERTKKSNLDTCLVNLVFNTEGIKTIFKKNTIEKVYFSSRYVEKLFLKNFKDLIVTYPEVELITLPSPSLRYALISKQEKIRIYKELLPKL